MSDHRNRGKRRLWMALLCSIAAFGAGGLAAQSVQQERGVIAPGGGRAAGGEYVLDGTLGQPVAGVASGGAFVLESGFHQRDAVDPGIFENGFES